jgi:hypothetical protein
MDFPGLTLIVSTFSLYLTGTDSAPLIFFISAETNFPAFQSMLTS